jgi:MFS family permease
MEGLVNRKTFASLSHPNFRLFFSAQLVSLAGTWIQSVALSWIAYDLTGSAETLGWIVSLQFFPLLFFGLAGGVIADVFPRYRTLIATQLLNAIVPIGIALAIWFGALHVWMLYVAALWQGFLRIPDNPVRHSFIATLVPESSIKNAVTLYSTASNLARVVGPAIAGMTLASFGAAWCFFLNGLSFLFVWLMLALMDKSSFIEHDHHETHGHMNHIKGALRHVRTHRMLRDTLAVSSLVGLFVYTFQVSYPLLAKTVYLGGANMYTLMLSVFGIGSIIGGVYGAGQDTSPPKTLRTYALALGLSFVLLAIAPTLFLALVCIIVSGFFSIQVTTNTNAILRNNANKQYAGTVLALWSMSIVGLSSIGNYMVGILSEHFGPQLPLIVSGIMIIIIGGMWYRPETRK